MHGYPRAFVHDHGRFGRSGTPAGLVPTDYRVPNGLSLDELSGVASRLAENAVVGVEVAEFEGSWSDTGAPGDPGPLLTALSPLVGG